MKEKRRVLCVLAAASLLLLCLPGCELATYGAAMPDPGWNLKSQQRQMDRQLGQTAHDRASAPAWMGYR